MVSYRVEASAVLVLTVSAVGAVLHQRAECLRLFQRTRVSYICFMTALLLTSLNFRSVSWGTKGKQNLDQSRHRPF